MATIVSTPTPGSPSSIHTPPTPRLGSFADNWEPYTPAPRKSARLSSRNATNRTPSPHPLGRDSASHNLRTSPRTTSEQQHQSTTSKMSSPATSPQKKRLPSSASRRASGSLTKESIANAAAALSQSQKMDSRSGPSSQAALALPTPAKTPARKHSEQSEKNVKAVARNLFGKQQSPNKSRAKRHNGGSLDTLEAEDEPIQIYTDSQDRLPEADTSSENPFFGDAGIAASAAPVRRSSRNKKNVAVESASLNVDETVKREDGLLYVFRGKKIFRKFSDDGDASSRSTVRPRLLFPTSKGIENDLVHPDEEAETDIEEHITNKEVNENQVETPAEAINEKADTPKAPKHAPASPPPTSRASRSKKIIADEPTPVKAKRGGSRSPFDGWKRTKKSSDGVSHGQKRAGDALGGETAPKRAKA